jgi:hypothetical protein
VNYTWTDLVYWSGFMAGFGICLLVAPGLGVTNHLVVTLLGVAVGAGTGWAVEGLYRKGSAREFE